MGDSFAAGMSSVFDLAGGICLQGPVSYPKLIAKATGAKLTDLTCNLASMATMRLQFGQVPADTDLITLTTGFNDLPWADLVVGCGVPGIVPVGAVVPEFGVCSIGNDAVGGLNARTDAYRANLAVFLADLHKQAPRARILLVGYPDIWPDPEDHCWPIVPLTGKDLEFYEAMVTSTNAVMIEFAKDESLPHIGYADTHYATQGHDMCKGAESWINPWFSFGYGLAPMHPTEKGIQAAAAEALRALGLAPA
jgi:lysophospholipase L1-like esterase